MRNTIFNVPNARLKFEDITSSLTKVRSDDTLQAAKMVKYGNLIVGQFRLTLGSDLPSATNFIRIPKPDTGSVNTNINSIMINAGVKLNGFIQQSTGYIRLGNTSETVVTGTNITCAFCYIAKEES